MANTIFAHKSVKELVGEVGAFITYDSPRCTKTRKDVPMNELDHNSSIIGGRGSGLYPLGHIVDRQEDVKVSKGWRERAHEINPPNIKYINFKNVGKGKFMTPRDISHTLAPITLFHIFIAITV